MKIEDPLLPGESWLSKSIHNMNLEDDFGCKICGKFSQTRKSHNEHLSKNHSKGAIDIATEIVIKNHIYATNNSKLTCVIRNLVLKFHSRFTLRMSMEKILTAFVPCVALWLQILKFTLKRNILSKEEVTKFQVL